MKKISDVASVRADLTRAAEEAGIEGCEGEHQHKHTRITKVCCLPWTFKKGDVAAMVGLYDGRKASAPLRQHFLFRGEYFLDGEEEKQMMEPEKKELLMENLQFCGEDPDT